MQGIIHESQAFDIDIAASPSAEPESEILVAVGVGPQILPDKNPPKKDVVEAVREEAASAVEDLSRVAGTIKDKGRETVDKAARTKENAENATKRGQVRERIEKKTTGWRSEVFDF